jgi:predicted nucleotidyltransferase component of viral defense system
MRPLHEIISWRDHAAWRTDAQVEQDLLITRAMVAIFSDPFLSSQVAMRGGTVLHKVHLAPAARYSEDIDLVLVGDRPISHVRRALTRVLQPMLGPPILSVLDEIQLAVRNAVKPSKVARMTFAYTPTVRPPERMEIKVEVNYTERDPFYAIADLAYRPALPDLEAPVTLRSYDLDEMLGTKLRALLQRTHGRDLFDLDQAILRMSTARTSAEALNPDRTVAAFIDYMRRERTRVTAADFHTSLDVKLRSRSFREDMVTMLPPGGAFDVDAAAERVHSTLLSRLPTG